eukprot:scaffold1098_cov417-Prasinococcus_capsulatus_cf.AAC.7
MISELVAAVPARAQRCDLPGSSGCRRRGASLAAGGRGGRSDARRARAAEAITTRVGGARARFAGRPLVLPSTRLPPAATGSGPGCA